MGRTSMVAALTMILSGILAAQTRCPQVQPASLSFFLPLTVPPGVHPYTRDAQGVWIFCDGARPLYGTSTALNVSGSDAVTLTLQLAKVNGSQTATAYGSSDPSAQNLSPSLTVTAFNIAPAPLAITQSDVIEIADPMGVAPSLKLPVTVTYTDAPIARLSASSMLFTQDYPLSSSPVQTGNVSVWFANSSTPLSFMATAESSGWLSVSPGGGAGYSDLTITADASNLAAGSYFGSIVVTSPDIANGPLKLPVRMVLVPVVLHADPAALTFKQTVGGPAPNPEAFTVLSLTRLTPFTAVAGDATWLLVSYQAGATTPNTVLVSVDGSKLAAGAYQSSVTINAPNASPITVPITLTIASGTTMTVHKTDLTYFYWPGVDEGHFPHSTALNITSPSPISWTATQTSGSEWFSLGTPASGVTSGTAWIITNFPPLTLAPGHYTGSVTISSSQATNSPQNVTLRLTVLPEAPLRTNLASFYFISQGGAEPAPQSVSVFATNPTSFSAAATGYNAKGEPSNWLSVTPVSGTTPIQLTVTAKRAGLTPDLLYSGALTLSVQEQDGTVIPFTLDVRFQVLP